MNRFVAIVLIGIGLALIGTTGARLVAAPMATGTVKATLSGFEEVPTLSVPGSGEFTARLSDSAIEYELSYANPESPVTAAHIHIGARGTNGSVVAFLCGGGGKPPCPAAPARVTGTINASNIVAAADQGVAAGELAEVLRAIVNEATYANVHTMGRPAGEIRGQISRGN
jgi:adenosylcobinamide amidohydrolase